jgi:hypothetical protein
MWDANMPRIERTAQLPHMLTWTNDGSVKTIIIRRLVPHPSFWLTNEQIEQLSEEQEVEVWAGEKRHDVVPDDDEDDMDSVLKEDEDEKFRRNDVLEGRGVILSVIVTDRNGLQDEAKEYMAGGSLVVSIEVRIRPSLYCII